MQLIIVVLIILFFPGLLYSAPSITSASISGTTVTVSGSSFGSGPSILFFDDFSDETAGQEVDGDGITGTYDTTCRGYGYSDTLLSNDIGLRVRGMASDNYQCNNRVLLGSDYTEVFVSSMVYIPDGYVFPRDGMETEETMPDISALKHFWVYDSEDGYAGITEGADLYGPNWTGSGWYAVASNDAGISTFDTRDAGWEWDVPFRWTYWFKSNGLSSSGTDGMFQSVRSTGITQYDYANYKAMHVSGHPKYSWDRISFPGYIRNLTSYDADHNYVIDDVYIAAGSNAAARVELGDNSVYANCTKLAIQTHTSWSSTSISTTLRYGPFDSGDTVYVFVIDSNNDPSSGYETTIPSGSEPVAFGTTGTSASFGTTGTPVTFGD